MSRPKVGFFSFTCCEGCQLQVLSLEDELPDLFKVLDITTFREASSARSDDYDIAIIDGAISRESEVPRLQKIREQCKTLITIGACSCTGGVNCIKNFHHMPQVLERVYEDKAQWFDTMSARPIWAVVPVDYQVPCCPIVKEEFLYVIKTLLAGQEPHLPNYPVCVECRSKGNVCVYDKGMTCLGPVTRAGCGACCPSYGNYCMGCRGLVDDPNLNSEKSLLSKHGLKLGDVLRAFNLFDGYYFDDFHGDKQ